MSNFIIDNMTWSYSRLSSYYTCPYCWEQMYVMREEGESSFFAEYGKAMHETLEKYAKNELNIFELNDYYTKEFERIEHNPPKNKYTDISENYFYQGIEYLNNINLDFDKYEILGVEKKIEFTIDKYKFVGYIDLLLRNKETGSIEIWDHKSRKYEVKKNGEPNAASLRDLKEFKKQLYLYSIPIIEEYKENPSHLVWNHFRQQLICKVDFDEQELEDAKQWALDTIKKIEDETEWLPNNTKEYFCNNICSLRNSCEYKRARF